MRQYKAVPVNPALVLKIRVPSRAVYYLLCIPLNLMMFHEIQTNTNLYGYRLQEQNGHSREVGAVRPQKIAVGWCGNTGMAGRIKNNVNPWHFRNFDTYLGPALVLLDTANRYLQSFISHR
jgi:hypothetical protein